MAITVTDFGPKNKLPGAKRFLDMDRNEGPIGNGLILFSQKIVLDCYGLLWIESFSHLSLRKQMIQWTWLV